VYIEFVIHPSGHAILNDIKREIALWAERHAVKYTQKTIKQKHRLGFDRSNHFTLFSMTWAPEDLDQRPWLNYRIVNVQNESY
jgi:hypothetical protein